MPDVNDNNNSASQPAGEGNSPVAPQTTPSNPEDPKVPAAPANPGTPDPKGQPERMIPYSRLQQVIEERNNARRELATARGQANQPKYENLDEVRNHPYVQQLELEKAENTLRKGAEEILQRYPQVPPSVKKAILRNPRGYVQVGTTDVPNALLDIEDYIQDITEGEEQPAAPQPKQFPVAGTNTPAATQGSKTPDEIAKILKKPVDEWTPEEVQKLEAHRAAQS